MSKNESPAGSAGGSAVLPVSPDLDALPDKMRVHALAKLIEVTSREVLAALSGLGHDARSAQSSIERKIVEQVIGALVPGAGPDDGPGVAGSRPAAAAPDEAPGVAGSRPAAAAPDDASGIAVGGPAATATAGAGGPAPAAGRGRAVRRRGSSAADRSAWSAWASLRRATLR